MEAESNPVSCPDPQKCSVRSHNSQWRTVLVEETKLLDLIWKTIKLSYLLQVTNKPISNYRTHRRASGRSFYWRKSRLFHGNPTAAELKKAELYLNKYHFAFEMGKGNYYKHTNTVYYCIFGLVGHKIKMHKKWCNCIWCRSGKYWCKKKNYIMNEMMKMYRMSCICTFS